MSGIELEKSRKEWRRAELERKCLRRIEERGKSIDGKITEKR